MGGGDTACALQWGKMDASAEADHIDVAAPSLHDAELGFGGYVGPPAAIGMAPGLGPQTVCREVDVRASRPGLLTSF